jgi:hypothetical protein
MILVQDWRFGGPKLGFEVSTHNLKRMKRKVERDRDKKGDDIKR